MLLENQYEIGLRGISVPLRSSAGEVVGAISASSTIERRHATDARDKQKLVPQHAPDVGRDLVRDAALSECAGDPLDTFGQGPAELAEDHLALAARAKNHAGTHELKRDIDSAGEDCFRAGNRGNRLDVRRFAP